jgi:hypothetical protein
VPTLGQARARRSQSPAGAVPQGAREMLYLRDAMAVRRLAAAGRPDHQLPEAHGLRGLRQTVSA